MMKIENSLAQTDLNQFKTEPLRLLVKQLYKHQNFKTKVVLERINHLTYTESTIEMYLTNIRRYLKDGIKNKSIAPRVYEIIEELKQKHESILTPSEQDKIKKCTRRSSNKPLLKKAPKQEPRFLIDPPQIIETKTINLGQYGVKINNTIKLFPTKDACMAYIECYREFDSSKDLAIVSLVIRYN